MKSWFGYPEGHEFHTESVSDLVLKYTGVDSASIEAYKQLLGRVPQGESEAERSEAGTATMSG